MVRELKKFFLLVVLLVVFITFLGFSSALQCWEHSTESACAAETSYNCRWQAESWGGWCEEINCWSLWGETDCNNVTLHGEIGKNCTWKTPDSNYGWCEQTSCWSFQLTNETACENNTAGLNCEWANNCNGYNPETDCWDLSTQVACENVTGCYWGECYDSANCGDYWQNQSWCELHTGSRGNACDWNTQYTYCYEASCWDYSGTNETWCESDSPLGTSLNCTWLDNYYYHEACEEPMCWFWDKTNETACVNNTYNLDCEWDGQWCMSKGCWSYGGNSTACENENGCSWTTSTSDGWCEEVMCWTWDTWNSGNESQCVNNAYGLDCTWENDSAGSGTGWCYPNFNTTCANFTKEYECMDTYYCWWVWDDWNNISAGGACEDPDWGGIGEDDIFTEWNPGCYVFDMNSTDCNNVIGCNYTSNQCDPIDENSSIINVTAASINDNGINCSMINHSKLCNDIPVLSSCCEWSSGQCQTKLGDACWKDAEREQDELGGIESCQDVSMQTSDASSGETLCNQIAGYPLYMPCAWSNLTKACEFKASDVFGNQTQSFSLIDNKKTCHAAGGKWIKEWYCEGNRSIPAGRCEQKGKADERNCDKACFACEYTFTGEPHNSTAAAKKYCYDSKLGYCKFVNNSNAPNGYGYCKVKEEFKQGIATDCRYDCGSCTYTGYAYSPTYSDAIPPAQPTYDTCNTPECYCDNADEFNNVTCKWVDDSSSSIGGYCTDSSEKTCIDACDRCYTRTTCVNDGRSAFNATGSCTWSNSESETDGTCSKNSGGDGIQEVCWDAVDNDNDNLIDCADSECFGDSFCGFISGDCFGWSDETSCRQSQLADGKNCTWITDPWGSWCDFPGSDCWKYDGNVSGCKGTIYAYNESLDISSVRIPNNNVNESITVQLSKLGTGWVSGSVSIVNATGHLIGAGNYTVDNSAQTITFTNNTFMVSGGGSGNITNVTYQYYEYDWGCEWSDGQGSGWCEQDWSLGSDCYNFWTEADCGGGSNCTWTNDTWCDGDGSNTDWCTDQGGWCDPAAFAPKNCWQRDNTNETWCENLTGCYYEDNWCMDEGCWNYDDNSTACDDTDGCYWETSEWSNCEVDWGGNCWQFGANESYCEANNCTWVSDSYGNWCDNKFGVCWELNEANCALDPNCYWNPWMWRWDPDTQQSTEGACDAICFNITTQSACTQNEGCRWSSGWCNSNEYGDASGVDCWQYDSNETACDDANECKWRNPGWCEPSGFIGGSGSGGAGGGAQTGMECWKYDGNQSGCQNATQIGITCMWMPEFRPFCEPNWAADCWQFNNESHEVSGANCSATTGCYWDANQNFCANAFDQCWSNSSLSSNETQCNNNANCNWTTGWGDYAGSGWCEPSCFQATTEATCTGNCRWMNGWCNTPGMYDMFGGMEGGAPIMIASDNCMAEISDSHLDLCGAGMRDMDDSFGFASGMADFMNAGICNNEKIGFGFGFGGSANNFGSGNETVKYYVYLDTDGETTGGCTLSHNSSAEGYEFFFKYISRYNASLGKATQTFNAYRCNSNNWLIADISLSAWKEKMCGEIQGPMIAVEKTSLEKYPALYDSEQDMRVFVSSAGDANNATSPSDSAGPGWVTPGAIDFSVQNFFDYSASGALFEEILEGGGFVQYEDCFNDVDDDDDNLVDCDDWDCEFAPRCSSSGVNAATYVDTSMPRITGVKIEEYTDAALVMYSTNKPANGTLTFWHNDSTCSFTTYNRTINDTGIYVSTMREFKLWHVAHLYNDSGTNSLDYPLTNGTTYYYKLKVCDSKNRCSVSACTSLRTADNTNKCGYCDFVTIISPPSGWSVNYDLNVDGTYEHMQGSMCGPKAGMKTNYSSGRTAHIKLNSSDGAEFHFLNVTLTKTGLTGDSRTIDTTGDLIYNDSFSGSIEAVGMIAETRDKIINNLHPEVCRIRIPNDNCNQLWHCDDTGNNCVRRDNATSNAPSGTADGTACIWTIPWCEFSIWATGNPNPSGSSSSSSTSSGGGGGGGIITTTNETTEEDAEADEEAAEEADVGDGAPITGGAVSDRDEGVSDRGGISLWVIVIPVIIAIAVIAFFLFKKQGKKKKYGY